MNFLFSGLIASILHVISGPDHLAAVTPLAIEEKKKSWLVGLSWGIGHTLGILIVGLLFIAFKEFIPVEKISMYSEQIVGIVLIIIGIRAFYHLWKHTKELAHTHHHKNLSKRSILAALTVGTIHGLAGVSHLLAIIPTLALPTRIDSVMYLSGFGVGSISAMVIYAFSLGFITYTFSTAKKAGIVRGMSILGGFAAIFVGIFWIGASL